MCCDSACCLKAVQIMSNVQQFHSLQRLCGCLHLPSPLLLDCSRSVSRLRRYMPRMACSLAMLISVAAHAQCPVQPMYPPTPAQSRASQESHTLQQDVRANMAAQKNDSCQSAKLFQKRTLSKEDLQELRRVVREHAKSKPMRNTADAHP